MSVIKFKRLRDDAEIPKKATAGAAGFDLRALEDGTVRPGDVCMVGTGLAIELPEHFAMLIVGRSGLGSRFGAGVPQGFGLIDSDYRGEIKILLRTEKPFSFKKGDAIAQAIITYVPSVHFAEAEELSETDRGAGGLGSTGA